MIFIGCWYYVRVLSRWQLSVVVKGGRMGRSDKVSLWCVALLINTRFQVFILE